PPSPWATNNPDCSLLLSPEPKTWKCPVGTLPGDGFPTACIAWRTRPVCPQSLNGKRAKVLVSSSRLSVDVLNDNTGGLLGSRVTRHTQPVRVSHEADVNTEPRTEVHAGHVFFGLSNGKSY